MLSDDRIAALRWQAERTVEEIINDRESVMRDIEAKGHEFWKNGAAQAWLDEAVPTVRKVVETVNGPLLQYLGAKALHSEIGCVEMYVLEPHFMGGWNLAGLALAKILLKLAACLNSGKTVLKATSCWSSN